MKFIIKLYKNHKNFFVKHTLHTTKGSDFKSSFSFKVRKYDQQQLCFRNKLCWTISKMVGAHSFPLPYLCIQPLLQSPPTIRSPTSATFHLPMFTLLLHNINLTITANTLFFCTSAILHFPIFVHRNPYNLHKMYYPYLNPSANSGSVRNQLAKESCQDWHCFILYLLPKGIERDSRAQNR